MSNKCPKCQTDNPDTLKFCGECGTQLPSLKDIDVTETIETPKEFKELNQEECREYVSNLEELVIAVNEAKKKDVDIDPDSATSEREKALLKEQKNLAESIDIPAFIVNDFCGSLAINDLDIVKFFYCR